MKKKKSILKSILKRDDLTMCRLLGHDIVRVEPKIINLPYGSAREEIEKRTGKKVTFLRVGDNNGHFFVLTATNRKEINKILKMKFRICKTCGSLAKNWLITK